MDAGSADYASRPGAISGAPEDQGIFGGNILLAAVSTDDRALLRPYLTRVKLAREQVLVPLGAPVEFVYFSEGGVASVTALSTGENNRTEIGIYGREGMSATHLLLDSDRSPHETFIQVDGSTGIRIAAARLIEAVDRSPSLRRLLLRFVQVMMVQSGQSSASNARAQIESRLARWLLMCHDRVDGDEVALTHEFMAMMIGAQRSGVTVALHILEGAGMIRSTRGRVLVLDRAKLEDLAGATYGPAEAEYNRLIGPFGKSRALAG